MQFASNGVTVLLLMLATVAHDISQVHADEPIADEAAAIKALQRYRTNLQVRRDDGRVRLVRFSKSHVTEEHIQMCRIFDRLDYLAVVLPHIGDDAFASLSELKEVDTLLLSSSGISDAGLRHFADYPKLERLYLDDTSVGDAGLETIGQFKSLKVLSLQRTKISDGGLKSLAGLENLETLMLNGTAIDGSGLEVLKSPMSLKSLHLNDTNLSALESDTFSIPTLEFLNLNGTRLKPEVVVAIGECSKLKAVVFGRNTLPANVVVNLARKLKSSRVYSNGQQVLTHIDAAPIDAVTASRPQAVPLKLQAVEQPIAVRLKDEDVKPDFQKHVIPLLGRLGCNGRNCHGSFQGRGGFRLSMFGYDFEEDLKSIKSGETPRVSIDKPLESLLLNKPTDADNHGGGKRLDRDSWHFEMLKSWIASGAKYEKRATVRFVRLEVSPSTIQFKREGESVDLTVVSVWSDGSREDVTALCRFESKDESIAAVSKGGKVSSLGAGDSHIIVFYDNGIHPVPVMRPVSDIPDEVFAEIPAPTKIDEFVLEKLRNLRVEPSSLCSDEEFLRRVSLDLIGTLPTVTEVKTFLSDTSTDKRNRKIDELLSRPEYELWWTQFLCDLTGSNAGYLGGTEMAQPVASQWRHWLRRRVRDDDGWDDIAKGIILATSRRPGESYEDYITRYSEYTQTKDGRDYAEAGNVMPHYWYRDNISPPKEKALSFSYIFMGIQLGCAECHKHPYDQWSQDDFVKFTSFFTRIRKGVREDAADSRENMRGMLGVPLKLNTAALRRQSYLRIAAEGRSIPWNEIYVDPPGKSSEPARLPGGNDIDLSKHNDPRVPLFKWLESPNNPYFATSFVNRVWARYFNVGIIEPPDDLNRANPPSNKPLLDWLSREFVNQNYSMKWLHRTIVASRTYQFSWQPTKTNRDDERNFSHAVIRRIPAEAVIDAMKLATDSSYILARSLKDAEKRHINAHPRFLSGAIDRLFVTDIW